MERLRAPLRSGGGAAGARSAPGRRLLAGGLVWRPFGPPNRRPPVDVANPRPPGGKWGPNESGRTPGETPYYRAAQPGPANLCPGAAGCPRHRRAPLRSGGGGGGRAQRAWPPAFGRRPSLAARWAAKPPPPRGRSGLRCPHMRGSSPGLGKQSSGVPVYKSSPAKELLPLAIGRP